MKKIFLSMVVMVIMVSLVYAQDCRYDDTQNFVIQEVKPGNSLLAFGDFSGEQGSEKSFRVRLFNSNAAGSMKVELGIYTKEEVDEWIDAGLLASFLGNPLSVNEIPNCVASQTNVDTKLIDLEGGESDLVVFTVDVPRTDPDDEYVVFVYAFENCYNSCGGLECGTCGTHFRTEPFDIIAEGQTVESCTDGIKNQDESDTDCGGVCGPCDNLYDCDSNDDCKTNYCDDTGNCASCNEEWTCEDWTGCDGNVATETRACTDTNNCGTELHKPQTQRACAVVEPQSDDIEIASSPVASASAIPVDGTITITADFDVTNSGIYLVEAGMGKVGELPLSITVSENTCDPGENWFANKQLSFDEGIQSVNFVLRPNPDEGNGIYSYWVAIVDECGGTVLHQLRGENTIHVGTREPTPVVIDNFKDNLDLSTIIFIILGIVGLGILIYGITKMGGKK